MSIWKMIWELEYWLHIGVADDIVTSPANRPEYQHLVEKFRLLSVKPSDIPVKVLAELKYEALALPFYKQTTFWVILKLRLLKTFFFWR